MKDRVAVKIIEEVIFAIRCKLILYCRRGELRSRVRSEKFQNWHIVELQFPYSKLRVMYVSLCI